MEKAIDERPTDLAAAQGKPEFIAIEQLPTHQSLDEQTAIRLLEQECQTFTRYLLKQPPTDYVEAKYREAHVVGNIIRKAEVGSFDDLLLRLARAHSLGSKLVDTYAALFARSSVVRIKLIVLLGILESCAPTHMHFDTPESERMPIIVIKLLQHGLVFSFWLLLSLPLLLPLHLISSFVSSRRSKKVEIAVFEVADADVAAVEAVKSWKKIVIVGSGASGVHFALSLLRKGYGVVMVDVGHLKSKPQNPDDTFDELKANLPDPAAYFLGKKYEAVVYPTDQEDYYTKYYGFPPSKSRIFDTPLPHQYRAKGFEPLFSFAQGGLAEAWTAGVYPLNEGELHDFPFSYSEIEPCYNEVAKRMGIMAAQDDLTKFFPYHENLLEPLRLDYNSQLLIAAYNKRKSELNSRLNCYLGRSRVGTLSADKDERPACSYCGRCLWGCPTESLYTPSITLRECRAYANFHYVPHMYVSHFDYDRAGKISRVVARSVEDQTDHYFTGDRYVLSAGALSSAKIFMQSIYKQEGRVVKLSGLMDNRQILIPFVNLKMLGKGYRADSYQYHQLAVGIESERPEEYIHGQITTLKSALVHPIIQNLPFDLRTSISVFRNLRSCLGIVNLNLYDRRRDTNYVSLEMTEDAEAPKLDIHYAPDSNEDAIIEHAVGTIRKFLWKLGCVVPPGMTHVRPMGASVHYTGTIPMSEKKLPLTTSKHCQSHDFENLYIVDGTTFPFLPAKNITFSLMANAVRVAERAF